MSHLSSSLPVDDAGVKFHHGCGQFISEKLDELIKLRHMLHAQAELSNKEYKTTQIIVSFLQSLSHPPEIHKDIGGGFIALFDFNTKAEITTPKTVVFRCELDALLLNDNIDTAYKSTTDGVAHKCGHDGHMTIVLGVAMLLSDFYKPPSGCVGLLFQPAEEIGEGALQMVNSAHPVLSKILTSPATSIFALHNVPLFPLHSIVLPHGNSFASASTGIHIKLMGATCHASQPHLGRNPALAMCNIVQVLLSLPCTHIPFDQKGLVTIVGAKLGDKSFGTSAGVAEIMATLRATTDATLNTLSQKATQIINGISSAYGLLASIELIDSFAATINNPNCVSIVQKAASVCGLDVVWMDEAFPWSEDFGIFLQRTKGAMFGLGVGHMHEHLHSEKYDFPDLEIPNGVKMFAAILHNILEG